MGRLPRFILLLTGIGFVACSPGGAQPAGPKDKSPDRAKVAVRTDRHGEPLPPGAIARLGIGPFPRLVSVYSVAFSPDGKVMASVGPDGRLRREKPTVDARMVRPFDTPLRAFSGGIRSVAVSSEVRGSASFGNSLVEWWRNWLVRIARYRRYPESRDPGYPQTILSFCTSSDGHMLAFPGHDGTLRIWAVAGTRELSSFTKKKLATRAVVFSPDGKTVASS